MSSPRRVGIGARWLAGAVGLAAIAYGMNVGRAFQRYGNPKRATGEERDQLLDRFMPAYDVVERHHLRVIAPARTTLSVARDMPLRDSAVVRALPTGRDLILGAACSPQPHPRALPEAAEPPRRAAARFAGGARPAQGTRTDSRRGVQPAAAPAGTAGRSAVARLGRACGGAWTGSGVRRRHETVGGERHVPRPAA